MITPTRYLEITPEMVTAAVILVEGRGSPSDHERMVLQFGEAILSQAKQGEPPVKSEPAPQPPQAEVTTEHLNSLRMHWGTPLSLERNGELTKVVVQDIRANLARAQADAGAEIARLQSEFKTERAMKVGCQVHLLRLAEELNQLGATVVDDEPTSERATRFARSLIARAEAAERELVETRLERDKANVTIASLARRMNMDQERMGDISMRCGARNEEVFWDFVERLAKERDEATGKLRRRTELLRELFQQHPPGFLYLRSQLDLFRKVEAELASAGETPGEKKGGPQP